MDKKQVKKTVVLAAITTAVGMGLGILFAPKKGSETRKDIKCKLDELVCKVKKIDKNDVKKEFEKKIKKIEKKLTSLDSEKEIKKAQKKAKELKESIEELWQSACDKGDATIQKIVAELKEKINEALENVGEIMD